MFDLLFSAVILISILTALFYIFFIPKHSIVLNVFGSYTLAVALFEIIAYFTRGAGNNNLYLLPIYTSIEFIQLSIFFFLFLRANKPWYLLTILVPIFIALNSLLFQGLTVYNSNAKASIYFLVLIFGLILLFSILRNDRFTLVDNTVKIITYGILINFSGSFILYLFSNYISSLPIDTQKYLWTANIILNILAQGIYFFAFFEFRRKYLNERA